MNDRRGIRTAMALAAIVASLTGGLARGGDTVCPGGTNCPGNTNGPGIHVSDRGSNCLWLKKTGGMRFCPESFENIPGATPGTGSVEVKGRLWSGITSTVLTSGPVQVRLSHGTETALLAVVPPDSARPSRLGFVYKPPGVAQPVQAQGAQLQGLTLFFRLTLPSKGALVERLRLELSFKETAAPGASGFQLYRYQGTYNNPSQQLSGPFCSLPADPLSSATMLKFPLPLSVLRGHQVDGETGVIKPSGSSVTLACVSGAIATCMEEWAYRPWHPTLLAAPNANPSLLLGACIQAKRAAYFSHPLFGAKDYGSYTKEGIGLRIQDDWLNTQAIADADVEAIWDDKGAVCFNPANQRARQLFVLKELNPQALAGMPACTPAHRQPNRLITGRLAQ